MSKLKTTILSVVGAGIVSAIIIPAITPDGTPSFVANNKTIELVYTDDNDGEDLIIHTDKMAYNDFAGADVYFSIENRSKVYQLLDIQFLFPEGGEVESIATLVKNVAYQAEIDHFTNIKYDCSFYQTSTDETIQQTCSRQEYTPYTETRYRDEWVEKEWFNTNLIIEESLTSDKKVINVINKKETLYFKAKISFKPQTSGEFYIIADGSAGGKGELDPWYNSSWTYRREITIDNTKVDDDLVNFPVAVIFSSSTATFANFKASGEDVRFTSSDGQTLIDYERERWASSTDGVALWVEVPTISSSTDTIFYMYYGNATSSDVSSSTAPWDSNFKMVQHMQDDPDTSNIADSTDNGNDGVKESAAHPAEQDAKIGKGQEFDGSQDEIDVGAPFATVIGNDTYGTFEAWVETDAIGEYQCIFNDYEASSQPYGGITFRINADGTLTFYVTTATPQFDSVDTVVTLDVDTWYHLVALYDGTDVKIYIDGVERGTATQDYDPFCTSQNNGHIGFKIDGTKNYVDGKIDEVRISNSARSVAWIKASYNSGKDTLLSIGDEETETVPPAVSVPAMQIQIIELL